MKLILMGVVILGRKYVIRYSFGVKVGEWMGRMREEGVWENRS